MTNYYIIEDGDDVIVVNPDDVHDPSTWANGDYVPED
jgi:hypothetical protein